MKKVEKLDEKLLEACTNLAILDSEQMIDIWSLEIKMYKLQLDLLDIFKPKWFQKENQKLFQEKRKYYEKSITKYENYLKIEEKQSTIEEEKMKM